MSEVTEEEIKKIEEALTSGKKVLGWCCVCGIPITDEHWESIQKVKKDDTYKQGFRVDNLKKHSGCLRK